MSGYDASPRYLEYLAQMGPEGDLQKAAWYVQREIDRLINDGIEVPPS